MLIVLGILLVTAGMLTLAEITVRWLMGAPASMLDQAKTVITAAGLPALTDLFEPDPVLFWKLRPNLRSVRIQGTLEGYPLDFTVSTDSQGRRITSLSEASGAPVLWALGDSSTFGLGVENDETWPAWLNRIAGDHQQTLNVINYGVPGYTAWQGLRQLEQLLTTEPPPDFLVAGFWANDKAVWMGRSDPETARMLRPAWFPIDWIQHLALFRLLQKTFPAAAGRASHRPRLNEREFTTCLKELVYCCQRNHITVALLVWPSRIQVEERQRELYGYQRLVQNTADDVGCYLINPAGAFMAFGADCFVDNFHGSALGCRLTAEAVWVWVSATLNRENTNPVTLAP